VGLVELICSLELRASSTRRVGSESTSGGMTREVRRVIFKISPAMECVNLVGRCDLRVPTP